MLIRAVETAINVSDVTISVEDELVEKKVERVGANLGGGAGRTRGNGLCVLIRTATVVFTVGEHSVFSQTGVVLSGAVRTGGDLLVCGGARTTILAVVRAKGGSFFVPRIPAVIVSLRRGCVCFVASCLVGACSEVIRGTTVVGQLVPTESLFWTSVPGQQPCVEDWHAASSVLGPDITVVGAQLEPAGSRFGVRVPGQQPCLEDGHSAAAASSLIGCGGVWGAPERSVPPSIRVVSCTLASVNTVVLLVVAAFGVAIRVGVVVTLIGNRFVINNVEIAGVDRAGGAGRTRRKKICFWFVFICTVTVDCTVGEQLIFSQTGVVLLGVVRTGGNLEGARAPTFACVLEGLRAPGFACVRDGGDVLIPLGPRVIASFRRGRVCCVTSCLVGASFKVILGTGVSIPFASALSLEIACEGDGSFRDARGLSVPLGPRVGGCALPVVTVVVVVVRIAGQPLHVLRHCSPIE